MYSFGPKTKVEKTPVGGLDVVSSENNEPYIIRAYAGTRRVWD